MKDSTRRSTLKDLPLIQEGKQPQFVIYTRRSREEDEKQAASIPQQIEACYEYVQKEEIALMPRPEEYPPEPQTLREIEKDNVGRKSMANDLKAFYIQYWVITERGSAKLPFQRKVWTEVIKLVRTNKIRGLMGYSPDRFARNLQEGGEVILLSDQKQVALKFTNFHFENNAAGQMMLGFWFVFAEHYSKKLSEDVVRGSKKKHLLGKAIGSRKYGYSIDSEDRFIPDPVYLPMLQKAFRRKLYDKWSDQMIVDEMNKQGWDQPLLKGTQNLLMTQQKVSNKGKNELNLWSDPFYYGVHLKMFKGREVKCDLRDLDDDNYTFVPAISEEEWLQLQEILSKRTHTSLIRKKSIRTKRLAPVKPVPDKSLICKHCNSPLIYFLPNRARFVKKMEESGQELHQVVKPSQIRYSCKNSHCKQKGFTILWSEIDDKIAQLLGQIEVVEEDYQAYLYVKKERLEALHVERKEDQRRVNILLNKAESDRDKFLENTAFGANLTGKKEERWQHKYKEHECRIEELQERKKELREDIRTEILDRQKFVEMIKNLGKYWAKATYVQKRDLLENILLNMVVNSKKQLKINIKPELDSMFIRSGGPGRI